MLAEVLIKVAGMEKQKRGTYYPRPSSAGPERCIRSMVYHGNATPEDKEMADRFVLTLDDSSWHEYLTADWIQKSAYQLNSQQMPLDITSLAFMPEPLPLEQGCDAPVNPSLEFLSYLASKNWKWCKVCQKPVPLNVLHGHIDGVITDMLSVDRLWEHKAINHFTWQKYAAGNAPLDYISQCCLYIKGLQKANPQINEAVLLIKNKNTAQYLEYIIEYDSVKDAAIIKDLCISYGEISGIGEVFENIVTFALSKFEAIQKHIIGNTLPERPYELGTEFPCGYCSWETTCWQNYVHEVAQLADNEADLQDIKEMVAYYAELGAQESEIKEDRQKMQEKIKAVMYDRKVRHGRSGDYLIEWTAKPGKRLKKMEEMPKNLLPQVVKDVVNERFLVKKIKTKKEK